MCGKVNTDFNKTLLTDIAVHRSNFNFFLREIDLINIVAMVIVRPGV